MLGTFSVDFVSPRYADLGLVFACHFSCFIDVKWVITIFSFLRVTAVALKST